MNRRTVALAGNPNVGKSSVFNGLTGLHQHTGNWAGKTVSTACGVCRTETAEYRLVDIPGTYSLLAHSAEEEVARDFLCFESPDAVIVVCDATCLERNLNLVLQIMELKHPVILCLNLMDEAENRGIHLCEKRLSERLGIPVVTTVAHKKKTLKALLAALDEAPAPSAFTVTYPVSVESAVTALLPRLQGIENPRFVALRLLEGDRSFLQALATHLPSLPLDTVPAVLESNGLTPDTAKDAITETLLHTAQQIAESVTRNTNPTAAKRDVHIDRVLTGKHLAYPTMLLLLALVFWITLVGANYPSAVLSQGLLWLQDRLTELFNACNAPAWLHGAVVLGAYRVLAWVVAVMLPPMAIFFPLFTLLEDVGYLPRIAYNLDRPFHRCRACGKQALTMCMGFGCNAVGVTGARIIDSPRERLLAILTNCFVPCNGRFPTLVTLLTLFVAGSGGSVLAAASLTGVIVLGILVTLLVTRLLSATLLKGTPSSFTLELPPYRRPQVGRILVRSLLDRTLFVLGRAAVVAAPVGLVLWILANVHSGGVSLLSHVAAFLDPFASLLGLDGTVFLAFILGFPANEIVLPIALMIYLSQGVLTDIGDLTALKQILISNGWTVKTAVCTVLFSLLHWPCSTTLLTVYRETHSRRWTAVAFLLPTLVGIGVCMLVNAIW